MIDTEEEVQGERGDHGGKELHREKKFKNKECDPSDATVAKQAIQRCHGPKKVTMTDFGLTILHVSIWFQKEAPSSREKRTPPVSQRERDRRVCWDGQISNTPHTISRLQMKKTKNYFFLTSNRCEKNVS